MNNKNEMPFTETLGSKIEQCVKIFEEMASKTYQANAAEVALKELEKDPSALTGDQHQRLLKACDKGMEVNPMDCKEYLQFKNFKERLEPLSLED